LLRELETLPRLNVPIISTPRSPTPPLIPSGLSDTTTDSEGDDDRSSDEEAGEDVINGSRVIKLNRKSPPTLRSLTNETKALYRDVIRFSSSPRVVNLSALNAQRSGNSDGHVYGGGRGWMPKKKTPAAQVLERKVQAEKLGRRVQGLLERASALSQRVG
jgi:dynactin 1